MTFTVVPQDPLVKAVIAALEATNFPVGDVRAPEGSIPYSVVYGLDDEDLDGPMNDWQADVRHVIQVTTVGETPEQARMLQDKNRVEIYQTAAPAGRSVALVERTGGAGVERDPDEQPPLFYSVDIYTITTTPA